MFGMRCLRRCTSLAPSPNPVEETRRKGFSFSHHESASSDGHRTVASDPVSRAFQILTDHDNLRPLHSEDVPERSLNGNDRCGVTSYFLASPLSRCRAGCHCLSRLRTFSPARSRVAALAVIVFPDFVLSRQPALVLLRWLSLSFQTSYYLASPLSRCRAGCHCLSGSLTSVLLVQSLAYLCIVCSRATAMCVCGVCARQMAVRRPTTAAR